MTKNTNIKIKFQQKCKTKTILVLLRAAQNLVTILKLLIKINYFNICNILILFIHLTILYVFILPLIIIKLILINKSKMNSILYCE